VLWAIDGWGPERVEELRSEHARQRQALEAVVAGLGSGWSGHRLARELGRLAGDLLRDMDDEEQGCLRPGLLCDDHLDYQRR
jgi:hypothetical protein